MLEKVKKNCEEILYLHPVDVYINNIYKINEYASYREFNNKNYEICKKIVQEFSVVKLDSYHKFVILNLILSSINRVDGYKFTDKVKNNLIVEYNRIIQDVDSNENGFYDYSNDLFCKDLSIASLRMFSAGLLKVESYTGIPRSCVLSNGGRDIFSWLSLAMRSQGFNPFYEIHLDVRYAKDFTPDGWCNALRTVGEMLNVNPHIKGITGASWFFDPQIRRISPHLVYLRELIEKKGGRFLFNKTDPHVTELAISKSNTRRVMYESKKYTPASYFMIWLKTDILRWLNL
jgi:hypothetical protein